jgi:hypothetical protein
MLTSRQEVDHALQRLGTKETSHTASTFHSHLMATGDLIASCGASWNVCLAGYFHSAYGTEGTPGLVVPFTFRERDKLQELIGAAAELLVYLFCCCDDRMSILRQVNRTSSPSLKNRLPPGEMIAVDVSTINDLALLYCANLVEEYPRSDWRNRLEWQFMLRRRRDILRAARATPDPVRVAVERLYHVNLHRRIFHRLRASRSLDPGEQAE